METQKYDDTLARAQAAVEAGNGLAGTGFWKMVGEVKRSPDLVEKYADQIAAVDQKAHANWALLRIPLSVGTFLAALATVVGGYLVSGASGQTGNLAGLVLLVGMGVILVATHGLAHLVTGWMFGMKFTSWFVGTIKRPQPGVKVDYSTYLRTPASLRAWMHASGAIVSKIVPFAVLPFALADGTADWVPLVLIVLGVGQILTDILWSVKASDWKKFRREMQFRQES